MLEAKVRYMEERLNQLIGFLVGDGFYYRKKSRKNYLVGFHQKRLDILTFYADLLSKVFNRKLIMEKALHGVIKVYIFSKEAYELFKEVKNCPSKYFEKLPQEEKIKFIGGFIDAEGYVRYDRIILYNGEGGLILRIKEFLEAQGIKATAHFHHSVYELHI